MAVSVRNDYAARTVCKISIFVTKFFKKKMFFKFLICCFQIIFQCLCNRKFYKLLFYFSRFFIISLILIKKTERQKEKNLKFLKKKDQEFEKKSEKGFLF